MLYRFTFNAEEKLLIENALQVSIDAKKSVVNACPNISTDMSMSIQRDEGMLDALQHALPYNQ